MQNMLISNFTEELALARDLTLLPSAPRLPLIGHTKGKNRNAKRPYFRALARYSVPSVQSAPPLMTALLKRGDKLREDLRHAHLRFNYEPCNKYSRK